MNTKAVSWGAIILAALTLGSQIVTYLQTKAHVEKQGMFLKTDRGFDRVNGGYLK